MSFSAIYYNQSAQYGRLSEKFNELENVSGYSIDELIRLFAKGCTLQPPEKPKSLQDILDEVEE